MTKKLLIIVVFILVVLGLWFFIQNTTKKGLSFEEFIDFRIGLEDSMKDSDCLGQGGELIDGIYRKEQGFTQGSIDDEYHFVSTNPIHKNAVIVEQKESKETHQCLAYSGPGTDAYTININYCCFKD